MAAPPNGESDPTRETILRYIKPPETIEQGGKKVARANRATPCHHRIAHLVINYLDGRRPDDQHIDVASFSSKPTWKDARSLCKKVLRTERNRRFERSLGSDPGSQNTILELVGVYAVCRRETKDERYHQELLVLQNAGNRRRPRCYCTYVSNDVVARGEWMVVGSMMCCNMTALRNDNAHDILGLYLAQLTGPHDMMSGIAAGVGSEAKIPVAMPVVAVKLLDADKSIQELGDLGDEAILNAYRRVKTDLASVEERLHKILLKQMSPVMFRATVVNPEIRHEFEDGKLLIQQGIRRFCKQSHQ